MRCACGYDESWHPDGRCPLCACGVTPGEHLPVAVPPSPAITAWDESGDPITWDGKTEHVCPGKPRTKSGALPTLRRGSFRVPDGPLMYRLRTDGVYVPVESAPESPEAPVLPPRVPTRFPLALSEIAPRAGPVGSLAADLGWRVQPLYFQAGDGTETSALRMHRGELHAGAQWNRVEGGTWRTAGALAWRDGQWPTRVTVTRLAEMIEEMGRS